ncbi:MAG TPA: HNH endonuclease [Chitinophagaceae bacterium]|nr:HNH endonuclease [Chitinophagaceae bacterium]
MNIPREKWVTLPGHKTRYGERYAISNYGRLVKYKKKPQDGSVLKCSRQEGYPIWRTRKKGEYFAFLIHRLVAKYFLPKPLRNEKVVIHHNYVKTDNNYRNLAWATLAEAAAHAQGNPRVIKARKLRKQEEGIGNYKLTGKKVKLIKILLKQGKTLKEIAQKFGVSDMQIYRIKTGENWGHIKP